MYVKVAGGKVLPALGIGTIDMANVNDKEEDWELSDVLLVPDLQQNLFSVVAITKGGFSFHVGIQTTDCGTKNHEKCM